MEVLQASVRFLRNFSETYDANVSQSKIAGISRKNPTTLRMLFPYDCSHVEASVGSSVCLSVEYNKHVLFQIYQKNGFYEIFYKSAMAFNNFHTSIS